MYSLLLLKQIFTFGLSAIGLNIISLLAVLCGIFVIITKNPVASILFLIGLFMCIASLLSLMGLNFIALSYLLVYVGAVSILFLFILMLINVRVSEILSQNIKSLPLAILTSILFYYPSQDILGYNSLNLDSKAINIENYTFLDLSINNSFNLNALLLNNPELHYVTGNSWDGSLSDISHITSIGNIMYTSYSIWLILTSIILLLAMVGAIVITIKPTNNSLPKAQSFVSLPLQSGFK